MSMTIRMDSHCMNEDTKVTVTTASRGMIAINFSKGFDGIDYGSIGFILQLYNNLVKQMIPELQKIVDEQDAMDKWATYEGDDWKGELITESNDAPIEEQLACIFESYLHEMRPDEAIKMLELHYGIKIKEVKK